MIIGISGKMGCGKDTVAKIIENNFKEKDFVITHFADPLKRFCMDYLGLSYNDVYTESGKKKFNYFWGMTNREILQKVGTNALRNGFDKDIWIKIMKTEFARYKNVLIPDVRFDNEAQLILQEKGIVLNVQRDYSINDKHISESGISEKFITKNILNNGTLNDLEKEVVCFLKDNI